MLLSSRWWWGCFGSQFHSSSLCHESVLSNVLQSFNILTSGAGASPTANQDILGGKEKIIKINLNDKLVVRGLPGLFEGRESAWKGSLTTHGGKEITICLIKLLATHTDLSQFVILMIAMGCGTFRFYISASHSWQLTAHWFQFGGSSHLFLVT